MIYFQDEWVAEKAVMIHYRTLLGLERINLDVISATLGSSIWLFLKISLPS